MPFPVGRILKAGALAPMIVSAPVQATSTADYVVMPFDQAKALLAQCSRRTPPLGESGWTPAPADIARFEAALPAALTRTAAKHPYLKTGSEGWLRQYVGMVRNGHRVIYGNFFPKGMNDEFKRWREQAVAVCDGGMAFFGAEFDADRNTIIEIDYNGYA